MISEFLIDQCIFGYQYEMQTTSNFKSETLLKKNKNRENICSILRYYFFSSLHFSFHEKVRKEHFYLNNLKTVIASNNAKSY